MAGPDASGWTRDLKAMAAELGVQDRIYWPGMLKGDLKWGAFRASEAFILPSHQDDLGFISQLKQLKSMTYALILALSATAG